MHITIKDHKIVDDWDTKKYLERMPDGKYTLKKFKRPRTGSQNSYLRAGVYGIIYKHTGEDPDVIHAEMSYKFLLDSSGKFPRIRSTTELSTVEFMEYVDKIILFWGEFAGLNFPTPEEHNLLTY